MMRPSAKDFSAAALALLLLLSTHVGSATSGQRQSCSGVLTHDEEEGYFLKADPASKSLWCASSIGEDEKSSLVQRVLKTCAVGSHCQIEGAFAGHGIFNWTQISAISL